MAYLDKCVAVYFPADETLTAVLDFMADFVPVERVAASYFRRGLVVDMVCEVKEELDWYFPAGDRVFISYHKYYLFYKPIFYDIFTQLIDAAPAAIKPVFIKIRKSIR